MFIFSIVALADSIFQTCPSGPQLDINHAFLAIARRGRQCGRERRACVDAERFSGGA